MTGRRSGSLAFMLWVMLENYLSEVFSLYGPYKVRCSSAPEIGGLSTAVVAEVSVI